MEQINLVSEHIRQCDLSMLALTVISGSFTSQFETGPTLTFSDSRGTHSPQC